MRFVELTEFSLAVNEIRLGRVPGSEARRLEFALGEPGKHFGRVSVRQGRSTVEDAGMEVMAKPELGQRRRQGGCYETHGERMRECRHFHVPI